LPLAAQMAPCTSKSRTTAASLRFALRCAHRLVIFAFLSHCNSPTACQSTAASTSLLAKVCRLQSQV